MDFPRILLITAESANEPDGNRQYLQYLLDRYSSNIVWYSLKPPRIGVKPVIPNVPYAHGENWNKPSGKTLKPLRKWFDFEFWSRLLGKRAGQFGKKHGVSVVWAIAETTTLVAAVSASQFLKTPLIISILDDPILLGRDFWSKNAFLPKKKYELYFEKLIHLSASRSVIGESMEKYYFEKYGAHSTVLYPGMDTEKIIRPPHFYQSKSLVTIGSAGNVYPNLLPEWKTLVEAIELLNSQSETHKFRILHTGRELNSKFLVSNCIEQTGWLQEKAYLETLEKFDLCFSTHSFSDDKEIFSRTSFPLKITSYIQAQRPILNLSPDYDAVSNFIEKYRCGISCNKLDAVELAQKIKSILFENQQYDAAVLGMKALRSVYTRERFFSEFEKFVSLAFI